MLFYIVLILAEIARKQNQKHSYVMDLERDDVDLPNYSKLPSDIGLTKKIRVFITRTISRQKCSITVHYLYIKVKKKRKPFRVLIKKEKKKMLL